MLEEGKVILSLLYQLNELKNFEVNESLKYPRILCGPSISEAKKLFYRTFLKEPINKHFLILSFERAKCFWKWGKGKGCMQCNCSSSTEQEQENSQLCMKEQTVIFSSYTKIKIHMILFSPINSKLTKSKSNVQHKTGL